jgi:hypothetical protein
MMGGMDDQVVTLDCEPFDPATISATAWVCPGDGWYEFRPGHAPRKVGDLGAQPVRRERLSD